MTFRYEITEGNEILLWDETASHPSGKPNWSIPFTPNGQPWSSKEEAETHIKAYIVELELQRQAESVEEVEVTADVPVDSEDEPTV